MKRLTPLAAAIVAAMAAAPTTALTLAEIRNTCTPAAEAPSLRDADRAIVYGECVSKRYDPAIIRECRGREDQKKLASSSEYRIAAQYRMIECQESYSAPPAHITEQSKQAGLAIVGRRGRTPGSKTIYEQQQEKFAYLPQARALASATPQCTAKFSGRIIAQPHMPNLEPDMLNDQKYSFWSTGRHVFQCQNGECRGGTDAVSGTAQLHGYIGQTAYLSGTLTDSQGHTGEANFIAAAQAVACAK